MIGLGERKKDAVGTGEPAVVVGVTRKYPEALLPSEAILPRHVTVGGERVVVDVVRAGPFKLSALSGSYRPAFPGASIANEMISDYVATLGGLVTDNATGQTMILSCAHALAGLTGLPAGSKILQPAPADSGTDPTNVIGELTRSVLTTVGPTFVDAAVATASSPSLITSQLPAYLMTGPTTAQPAVGMVVASDVYGGTVMNPIDAVLSALGVSFGPGCTAPATVGMNVQKFARTTAYTSAVVDYVGVTVTLDGGPLGLLNSPNQILVNNFSFIGDSGAVACAGGEGDVLVIVPISPCAMINAVSTGLNIPDLLNQVGPIDEVRDRWLSTFALGSLVVGTYYMNQTTILDRINGTIAGMTPQTLASCQSYAQSYYAQDVPLLLAALANPAGAGTFTTDDYNQATLVLEGAYSFGFLTQAEYDTASSAATALLQPCIGMDYGQVYTWVTSKSVFDQSIGFLSSITALKPTGPISPPLYGPVPPLPPPGATKT